MKHTTYTSTTAHATNASRAHRGMESVAVTTSLFLDDTRSHVTPPVLRDAVNEFH